MKVKKFYLVIAYVKEENDYVIVFHDTYKPQAVSIRKWYEQKEEHSLLGLSNFQVCEFHLEIFT